VEFEFVSSFGLPAMPVSSSIEIPDNISYRPLPVDDANSDAEQAGI
jgi:hypothetical protein